MSTSEYSYGAALPRRIPAARRAGSVTLALLLLLVVGSWIAVADGLTRPAKSVETLVGSDALLYEPFLGGLVFAAATFPLVLLHAWQVGASKREGLLLWFVLCTVAYAKDFAYLQVPQTPLYVTDIVLAVLMFSTFIWPRLRWVSLRSPLMLGLLAFLVLGVVALIRGILSGSEVTRSFRDFSMVVYPAFVLIGLHMLVSWESLQRVGQMLIMGALMASLNGVAWFVAQPGLRRYIAFGIWIAVALVGLVVMMLKRLLPTALGVPLAFLLVLGLMVSNARTLYVVLGIAGLLFLLAGRNLGRVNKKALIKVLAVVTIAIVATVTFLTQTKAGQDYVARESEQLVSGVARAEDDDNAQFRLLAWGEAMLRFIDQPVLGEGFGIPFTFELADSDPRPHNTYLTVLYKMGLTGILPLLFSLGYVLRKSAQVLRRHAEDPKVYMLHVLLLSQIMLCSYGVLNLLLESPFLASLFWLNLGMCWRAALLLRRNHAAEARVAA